MNDFAAALSTSPLLYPQKYDPARDAVAFLRFDPAAYRAASFLDDRVLPPGAQDVWTPWVEVEQAPAVKAPRPLHFIFHTGHVGSTLLSRLIDETGATLGLREPLPLRTLAQMADAEAPLFAPRLDGFLKLWSRGFPATSAVVLKATSSTGRIATRVLAASPASRALYLNLRAEPYLATLLAGANALVDLRGFEFERIRRLRARLGGLPPPVSIGELAAASWLAETTTQRATVAASGDRVLALDFDAMLADLPAAMASVLAHMGIAAPPGFVDTIARSPVLTRYSKAPEQFGYSPQLRRQILAQARAEHGGEIRRGLLYLEKLAAQYPDAAAVL